jgi:hypothetical protein
MNQDKVLRGILDELKGMNARLTRIEGVLFDADGKSAFYGLHVAIAEFHRDVGHEQAEQDQTAERLRERHSALAARLDDAISIIDRVREVTDRLENLEAARST